MSEVPLPTLYRLAEESMHRQDFVTAESYCRQMLDRKRDEPNALGLLAHLALTLGDNETAIRHMTAAAKAAPKEPSVRVQFGRVLAAAGRYTPALAQFERALKLAPDLEAALAGKASTLERKDRYAAARRVLEPAIRRGVRSPVIVEPYLRILIHDGDYDAAAAVGRECAAGRHREDQALRNMLFELARAEERRGDHDAAFATARRANAVLAPPYDPLEDRWRTDALIATFTSERLAALPRATQPSAVPVFIVGMPRSGSTLTERIIHTHPQAFGAGEISHVHRIAHGLQGRLGSIHPWPKCAEELTAAQVDAIAAEYLDDLARLGRGAKRVANKNLGNFKYLGLIQLICPGARIIHCRRDPVDMCLSCYMERLTPASAPYATDLRALGLYHRQYERLMAHWAAVLDLPVLTVDYERLVDEQETVTRQILDFCALEWDERCLKFHETKRHDRTLSFDQVRRPLYRSSVGRAERFAAHLDPLRRALAGETD